MMELQQQHSALTSFQNLVDVTKTIPKEAAEGLIVAPLCELHKALTKILKDNNIATVDQVEQQQKMAQIIDSMANVQQEILKSANNNKIKALLDHFSTDI